MNEYNFKDSKTKATLLFIATGMTLFLLHLFTTPTQDLTHDIIAHFHYIQYIANHYRIPKPNEDWAFYHPPLYYILAAIVFKAGAILGMPHPMPAVCFLSLFFYMVYLYFSIRLLMENVRSPQAYYIALAMLVFWPLGVNMARLINNDVPLFMAQIAGFYYLMRWWKDMQPKDMVKALLWNAIAINFKSSGIILSIIIAVLVLLKWMKDRFSFRPYFKRNIIVGVALAAILAALPLGRSYYYYRVENIGPAPIFFMAGISLPPENNVPGEKNPYLDNQLYHYLSFDITTYLTQPFYQVWNDIGGRGYFWNSVLKTSVLDEFVWKDRTGAIILSAVELLLVLYVFFTVIIAAATRKLDREWLPFIAGVAIQLASLMLIRIWFSAAWHQEYRFIYATTALFCVLYAKSIEWNEQRGHKTISALGTCMGIVFIAQSILFILEQDLG